MRFNLYSQSNITVVISGVPWTGFMEGDFLSVKLDGNAAERTMGASGSSMNISADYGGKISVALMDTSPSLGIAYQLRNLQRLKKSMFTIALLSGVNEIITASGCAFGDTPEFSTGGPKMGGRGFTFEAINIAMDTAGIESVAGLLAGGVV